MVLLLAILRLPCFKIHWEQMMELRLVPLVVVVMAIMMSTLMAQHLVYHWDLLMDLYLALIKA